MLNYRLVIVSGYVVIGLILYLFYWNRIIGYILSLLLRLLFWNQKESSVWVDIGSIHFSLLGGRILLKDLRYHSSNQTIRVVKGQISWRYWIRAPADEEDLSHARVLGESVGGKLKKTPLSCRVHIVFQGLEWFLYNRTAAYDGIVSSMEPQSERGGTIPDGTASTEGIKSLRKIFTWTSAIPESANLGPPISLVSSIYSRTPKFMKSWIAALKQQLPSLDPKDLLPFGIEVRKGAVVIGNESTPTLLVVDFKSAEGTYGIVPARSQCDHYKQVINLKFQDAIAHFMDNDRFESPMISTGEKLHQVVQTSNTQPLHSFSYLTFNSFAKLWRRFKLKSSMPDRRRHSHFIPGGASSWSRRMRRKVPEEETPLGADFSALEYAKDAKIMEAPVLEFLYYADSVGQVPTLAEQCRARYDPFDIGNGDLPPEWGMDLAICGGVIRYGPWADRQRAILQQTFFPSTFTDATPFVRLKPGDARVWPSMNILIELKDGVSLQIPFREASKNWQWDGEVDIPNRPRKREAASIHLRAGDNSTISYTMPLVATSRGYEPSLNLHLDTVTVTSSLNDIRLLTAESCVVRCEMPSPLRWNEQRLWTFSISLRTPLIYLLRDHVNMFTDLGKDWASGPPSDYNRFIPIVYSLHVEMKNYDLKTYVNDHNIIDKPLIPEDNALLSLYGALMKQSVIIPLTRYRPQSTTVSFDIETPDIGVSLTLPKWNTHSLFGKPHRSSELGRIGLFSVDASYCYFSDVHPENIDQLKLMFTATDVVYKACGWTIRYFMSMRNNYFGSFTHFSTLNEYLAKRRTNQPIGDPIDLRYREGSSNALQVELGLLVTTGLMVVPASLRGYKLDSGLGKESADIGLCTMMALPELQLQLRTHDYYMEMTFNIDSISTSISPSCPEDLRAAWDIQRNAKEILIIDSLDIVAHRLFGPLPRTSTYFCIWEFHIGNIAGRMDALEARSLAASGRQFSINFTDPLNAPAQEYEIPTDPDVTFLKLTVDQVNLVWHVGNAAAELSLPKGIRLDLNDVAGKFYKSVTSIRIPQALVKLLISRAAAMNEWHEAMEAQLDFNVDLYSAPDGWREKAQAQAEFLAAQDSHTERVRFLYMPDQALPFDTTATGRGLLDTEFFIPQVRIPKASKRISVVENKRQESRAMDSGYAPSPLALPRHLANYSESDGEDYVSEADRDARLAQTRPLSRIAIPDDDNESISSGDESDNDDLYSDHSDSEIEKSGLLPDAVPVISQYGRYTRAYAARCLYRPSHWHSSPFYLKRHNTYNRQQFYARKMAEKVSDDTAPCTTTDIAQLSSDFADPNTVVRIASKSGVYATATPLIIPVLHILASDMVHNQISPDIRFDALFAEHLQSVKDQEVDHNATTIIDVHLGTAQIKMLQLFPSTPGLSGQTGQDNAAPCSRSSSVEILSSGFHIKTAQAATNQKSSLACSFQSLSLGLGAPEHSSPAWDIACSSSSFALGNRDASVTLGEILVNISQSAPSQIVTMGMAMSQFVDDLQEPIAMFRTGSTLELNRTVLLQALQREEDRAVLDPLSTIQPSYLVQSGRPHRLRTDPGFKFLFFLRHHLLCMGHTKFGELFQLDGERLSEECSNDVTNLLKNQLMDVAGDVEVPWISIKSPISTLLRMKESTADSNPPAHSELPITSAVLKLSHLRVTCCSVDGICSEFVLNTARISVQSRSTASYHPYVTNVAKSTTTLTSARDRSRQDIQHIGSIISVGDVSLSIYPPLMSYARSIVHVLKVHHLGPFGAKAERSRSTSRTRVVETRQPRISYVDLALTTRSVKFKAGAEKLVLEYKASALDFASCMLFKPSSQSRRPWDVSMNHSLTMDEIRVQACTVADLSKPNEYGVLAAFIVGGGRINVVMKRESDSSRALRATVGLEYIHLNVPRSAIRLYRFMEEWRADYLPGLNATVQDLVSELNDKSEVPKLKSTRVTEHPAPLSCQADVQIGSLRVSLQVMRGTWLSWELGHIVSYALYMDGLAAKNTLDFGLQIGTQVFVVSSKDHASDPVPNTRMKIPLPSFSVRGHHNKGRIEGLALVEMFSATIKPSHWDTLLTVQQKFGKDFNDLMSIIAKTREKTASTPKKLSSASLQYRILARMKGFRLGLESGSSILLLDCDHIGGAITNESVVKWHIELGDLALSHAPRSRNTKLAQPFDRGHRTAFVSIDAKLEMGKHARHNGQLMKIEVNRVHAVMQPSSIGELGDFVDHLQAEISMRKERRAHDMAEFKEKTKNLLRTLDITTQGPNSQPSNLSWLDHYTVDISLANIGVAFPLTLYTNARLAQSGIHAEGAVRAFLFSIKSITFGAKMGESGQASMKGFSFQFVSRFRQSNDSDFAGENHPARNRLLYPEMTAQLRIERSNGSRQLHINADVDGFILDIESSIPNYVSSLIEVYRHGKDRVERFANGPRIGTHVPQASSGAEDPIESNYYGLLTSNIFLSLTFRSGRVRMLSNAYTHATRTRAISALTREYSDDQFRELGVEVFDLPVVSVWGEYRATPAANKLSGGKHGQMEPSTLLFKSTVHSSQNTLRPTLLPFLAEVIQNIEDRMMQASKQDSRPLALTSPRIIPSHLQQDNPPNPVSSMQISLSLRIDKSKLELTCLPDVNVIAGLNWDSGGFVVNISPGAHRVTLSGGVEGLTAGLKHGFLSEDCMKLHARNLAFSVDFAKARESNVSSVSVVCDTEFSGGVHFLRLQDVLCFKAVWLDRIPVLNAPPATPGGLGTRTNSHATNASSVSSRQELSTVLILRLREVRLDIDLGQSITWIQLNLRDAILRTKMSEALSEVSLSVSEVLATATGNITGKMAVPRFLFQTTRKQRNSSDSNSRLLDLQMTSGALIIDLDSEYQKLLVYRAEPLDVRIYDDWSRFSPGVSADDHGVRLTFTVKGTDVTAIMSVNTIPKLVGYGNKFTATLDAQKEGASRESQAFRVANSPKPDNALSEVANAMFSSARSKLMEEPGFNGVIGQRLSLKLRTLRLVVFPRTMSDPELAQFIGSNVHARLDRVVESDILPPARDLQLSFTSISISKITSLNYPRATKESTPDTSCQEWLSLLISTASHATIFSLPAMTMQMHSDETVEDGVRILPYDFTSRFSNAAGVKEEDIYVTLNMSLYSWLTILRKTFTREMEQVQASADVRAAVGASHGTALRGRKPPEPLQIRPDRDITSGRNRIGSPTPISPLAKVRASLPHTKSTPTRLSTLSPTSSEFLISPISNPSQPASAASAGIQFPLTMSPADDKNNTSRPPSPGLPSSKKTAGLTYRPRQRTIERLTLRQLGEATPDVMHPFFMKTAGFSLEDSLPQYVHEYATMPTEEIMKALLKLYSKQLKVESSMEI